MLATGLISSSGFDLWAMIKQWNRRRRYHDVVSSGYDPFTGQTRTKRIKVKEVKKTAAEQQRQEGIKQIRNEIASRMLERNLPAAAELYLELMRADSKQILPRQELLDIANQLASEDKPAESAQAYEQFLTHYGSYQYVEQVELMLGVLYSRYLHNRDLAVKHLQAAAKTICTTQHKTIFGKIKKLTTGAAGANLQNVKSSGVSVVFRIRGSFWEIEKCNLTSISSFSSFWQV